MKNSQQKGVENRKVGEKIEAGKEEGDEKKKFRPAENTRADPGEEKANEREK